MAEAFDGAFWKQREVRARYNCEYVQDLIEARGLTAEVRSESENRLLGALVRASVTWKVRLSDN